MFETDTMKLVVKKTGITVAKGDKVVDFRGDPATVDDASPPHSMASAGRIYVMLPGITSPQGYFPSVFGCAWVEK